jgi:hypothetical protein
MRVKASQNQLQNQLQNQNQVVHIDTTTVPEFFVSVVERLEDVQAD